MKNDAVLTTSTTGKAEEAFVSRAEYDALKRENAELNQKLDFLMGQLRLAKKKMFGASSEQAAEQLLGQLSFLFNEAEADSQRRESVRSHCCGCPYPAEAFQRSGRGFARRALPLRLWSTAYQKLNGSAMPAAR